MPNRWVVNASPLIILAKIDSLHLLTELAEEIVVPRAVLTEIIAGPVDDPARLFLNSTPLPIVPVVADPMVLAWDLGNGETAVLSHALTYSGWTVVIDDGAARRCARALDIPLIGTLGVIIKARQVGLIPAAAPILKELQLYGFRLDERIVRQALLQTVGEDWE